MRFVWVLVGRFLPRWKFYPKMAPPYWKFLPAKSPHNSCYLVILYKNLGIATFSLKISLTQLRQKSLKFWGVFRQYGHIMPHFVAGIPPNPLTFLTIFPCFSNFPLFLLLWFTFYKCKLPCISFIISNIYYISNIPYIPLVTYV